MAHREPRDRGAGRDWDRSERDDRPRRDREPRDPNRDRERDRAERDRGERDRDVPRGLNEYFVEGEGIHREVMQREICKYLGPEALSRPHVYNGISGYIVTAVRPFTPQMIEDLQALSKEFVSENRDLSRRGYEGVPYTQSQTSMFSDRQRQASSMMSSPDIYNDSRYGQVPPNYSTGGAQSAYATTAGYPPGISFQPSQIQGYEPSLGYPQVGGYPAGSSYPQASGYSSAAVYPTVSGYTTAGYPAQAGRPGNEQNYTYNASGDYSNQNHQYRAQQYPSPSGARPGESMSDPTRVGPRYPQQFVTSQGENPVRGVPAYDTYGQAIATGQPRGSYNNPRGTPTGYDGQPLDGGHTLDERRRR